MDTSTYDDNKIHLRSLHGLTSDEIKSLATTNFPLEEPDIEWKDDTSADLVYSSQDMSAHALEALTHDADIFRDGDTTVARMPARRSGPNWDIVVMESQMHHGPVIRCVFRSGGRQGYCSTGRSADGLAETEKFPKRINDKVHVISIAVSVTNAAGVAKTFDEIVDRFGVPHVLVNNAGCMASADTIFDSDIGSWWEVQEVNVEGNLMATKAFLSKSRARALCANDHHKPDIGRFFERHSAAGLHLAAEHRTITSVCIDPDLMLTSWTDTPALGFLLPLGHDTFGLVGAVGSWVASGDKSFLSGRYLSINWDVEELEARKGEIVEKDLLTLRQRGEFGGPDLVIL
ncbi:hypothetical protein BJY01DRAFT_247839 [Aspergillus pseudoustus]|uniref:NAD(P)-binding protein n=1 Tax=Aspergillus pseudoustus TaxID=1810923 RepID=A0ABR4JY78_9EURO